MSTAYEYVGEDPRDYPGWGLHVKPGDVVYLNGRPPSDGRFVPWSGQGEPATAVAATEPSVTLMLRGLVEQLRGGLVLDDEQLQEQLASVDVDDAEQVELGNKILHLVNEQRAAQATPVKRPNKAASAEEWRAYAVSQGMSEEEAAATTRQALIDKYKYTEGV